MYDSLKDRLATDKAFRQKYEEWVKKQGWTLDEERHRNIADQAAYILINKFLFYKALERRKNLPSLTKKENVAELLETLRECFEAALKIDYRAVFQRDPIYDEIPLTPEVAQRLNILIAEVSEYDLSKMKRDIIGTLYEKLIPKDERRTLGQFYTPPQIVELIVKMCVRNPDDKVLDPGCGSGGFLVASYDRLLELKGKTETDEETHQELLSQIWGVDINKFPAHLATINLASQNLESQSDHINVVISDFFNIREPTQKLLAPWSVVTLDGRKEEVEIPLFDAVVANPPYTRTGDIPKKQKKKIRDVALRKGKKIQLSAQAGIYAYFFVHGAKFLRNAKRMGMVVSNSWLDVGYGKDLQRFFLDHFKILTIIDAEKRVFADAEVNTVIIILEKATGKELKKERDDNLVKFVRLKKHMKIDDIIETIDRNEKKFSNETIAIHPKWQRELHLESKWGKYVIMPEICSRLLEDFEDSFVPLEKVARIRLGLTTGYNNFFYLKEEEAAEWQIEPCFLKRLVKSPRECKAPVIDKKNLKLRVFFVNKKKKELEGTNALKYIKWGENHGISNRPFFASRTNDNWYRLYETRPLILHPNLFGYRHGAYYNPERFLIDKKLIGVEPREKRFCKTLCALLNCSISILFREVFGSRQLGGGALDISTKDCRELPVVNLKNLSEEEIIRLEDAFDKLSTRELGTVFEEIGAWNPEDVSLEKVKPDRRSLDDVVLEILGLGKEEQLQIYRSIVELVRNRMVKAEDIEVLVGPEFEREKPWPLSSKELEEIVTLLQLSKIGRLTEEQESTLGRRAGGVVRDLAYEIIRLRHEPMSVNEVAQRILDIGDDVLSLAGYFEVINEVMGGKTTPKQVVRDLLGVWRDQPEGIEKTISRLLSGDGRFLQIESGFFGLMDWSPNELFQIYVQLVSKYRITDYEKKETFKGEAIGLLESGEVDFPDKDGLIQTLRRL